MSDTDNIQENSKPPTKETLDELRQEGFRPSVIICCINDKKVLMLHKKDYGIWMFPQGGINNDEDLNDAIFRQLEEEMGEEFVKNCDEDVIFFGDDQIEFLPGKHDNKKIVTGEGLEVDMIGKKFYLYAVACKKKDIDIKKTDFDDYFWLEYKPAMFLARKIYQRGKSRVTTKIIDLLKKEKLIN